MGPPGFTPPGGGVKLFWSSSKEGSETSCTVPTGEVLEHVSPLHQAIDLRTSSQRPCAGRAAGRHFEARGGHFGAQGDHFEAQGDHFEAQGGYFGAYRSVQKVSAVFENAQINQ